VVISHQKRSILRVVSNCPELITDAVHATLFELPPSKGTCSIS
jgi:hypothetical protein